MPASTREAFATSVSYGDSGIIEHSEFLRRLADERRQEAWQRRTVEAMRFIPVPSSDPYSFQALITFESYTDPPGTPGTGGYAILVCDGTFSDEPKPPKGFLSGWSPKVTPLYSAESRNLDGPEAKAWLASFLRSLDDDGSPDLESFLLPIMLLIEPSDSRQYSPAPRETLAAALRASRAGWATFNLAPVSTPSLLRLTGARWQLDCDLRQSRTHRDGRKQKAGQPLHWQIEVVFTEGRWQALRIRL